MGIDVRTPELVAVGIDGSQHCEPALAWAGQEARAHGKRLCVFHCWQPSALVTVGVPGAFPPSTGWRDARDAARIVLDDAMAWLGERFPALPITGTLMEGPAGQRLVANVRRGDTLVLGPASRHRVAARLLGSTLNYALRHARGTVVVLPADEGRDGTGPFGQHVVAGVDDLESASTVLGVAFAEAAAHGWPLAVVHADRHGHGPVDSVTGEVVLAGNVVDGPAVSGAIEAWRARYPQVTVRRARFNGPPAVVLEHVSAGAGLLVVGRSSHPMRPVRLIDLLLARVGCPVAVAPPAVETQVVQTGQEATFRRRIPDPATIGRPLSGTV